MITLGALDDAAGVRHGFFTREGGVSKGPYASLNCGFGSEDAAENVAANRTRAMARLGIAADRLATCYQIHSPTVIEVDSAWSRRESPRADGMVTRVRGLALGILTADCAPVLFADPEAGIVGAAPAGWRGAVGGVLEATVEGMVRLGAVPGRIRAGIGPCIAQPSYEVGPEFPAPFLAEDPSNSRFFIPSRRDGHFLFDLPGYVECRLGKAGVVTVQRALRDTAAEEECFFSWRRTSLRGGKDYGRLLSAIALEA
jgi:YfiH family protein